MGDEPKVDEAAKSERPLSTWDVQPRWVKVLTVTVAVPAWLVMVVLMITGNVFRREWLAQLSFGLFCGVAVLQLFFLARAHWRMDL